MRILSRICLWGFLLACGLLVAGCLKNDGPTAAESLQNIIYFNSFETAADTAGIGGYGGWTLSDEASPGGGERSLYVSGGCIWPHVIIEIPAQAEDGHYLLTGWGKNPAFGGVVELSAASQAGPGIHFFVSDSTWNWYIAADTLFCPANQAMTLIMGAGGYVPSAMLVDQITISKVNE